MALTQLSGVSSEGESLNTITTHLYTGHQPLPEAPPSCTPPPKQTKEKTQKGWVTTFCKSTLIIYYYLLSKIYSINQGIKEKTHLIRGQVEDHNKGTQWE